MPYASLPSCSRRVDASGSGRMETSRDMSGCERRGASRQVVRSGFTSDLQATFWSRDVHGPISQDALAKRDETFPACGCLLIRGRERERGRAGGLRAAETYAATRTSSSSVAPAGAGESPMCKLREAVTRCSAAMSSSSVMLLTWQNLARRCFPPGMPAV